MASRVLRTSLACLPLAGLLACNNDPGDGSLTVNYKFGIGGSPCATEGVEQIRVTLGDETRTDACDDNGEIILSGIAARNYSDFLVEGIDAAGVTIRDNLDAPDTDEAVEILGGASQTIDVTLTPTPATIEITFLLNDAEGLQLPSLDASDIESFTVSAAQGASAALLVTELEVSELQSARVIVPDPERDLDGQRMDTIVIEYDGGNGTTQVDGDPDTMGVQSFTFEPPGDGRQVSIRVTCNGDTCEGMLEGITGGSVTTGADGSDGSGGGTGGGTGG